MPGYDLVYSPDDGFWYVEAYGSNGKDVCVSELGDNHFASKDTAIQAMRKWYPCFDLINIL